MLPDYSYIFVPGEILFKWHTNLSWIRTPVPDLDMHALTVELEEHSGQKSQYA